ncbi:MAG: SpoIIE family protein phosphatase [Thermoleophilia bacterium]|jgi:serine phosphatase RsbU (regulator of sigma subunit)/PAS domain-containing protein
MNILIVEDNPGDVRLLEEYLADAGLPSMVLLKAVSIVDASRYFEEGPVDVILLDLGLPDGQGIESLRKIRKLAPIAPIIVLTGEADEDLAVEALREGAQDYLIKNTINASAVSRVVRYTIERAQAELRIRESEDRYRGLFETMAQGVVYHDACGRVTSCNPAAERILGWDSEATRGRSLAEIGWRAVRVDGCECPPEQHPAMVALREGVETSGIMGVLNSRLDCWCWIDVHAMPRFRSGEKTPYEVFASFADITELRELEAQRALAHKLQEAMEKLAAQNMELQMAQAEAGRLLEEQRTLFHRLQETLLDIPQDLPGVKFGHLYHSATQEARIGGDFYDVFEARDGCIGLLIGDVSGHGVEAARTATLVKDTVLAFARQFRRPHVVLRETNKLLVKKPFSGFVTAFLCFLDPRSGVLIYSSAGHPCPLVKVGGEVRCLESVHMPLGTFEDARYTDREEHISEGSLLLFYTDGIIEARKGASCFGEERLVDALKKMDGYGVEALPTLLLDEALRFSGGRLDDDVALLAVDYLRRIEAGS